MDKPEIINANLRLVKDRLVDLNEIKFIIIHHTGVKSDQSVEIIHNYHKNVRGWAGIGYHFYIRFNGDIYQGRPLSKRGAHTKGYNDRSIGVALAGDFTRENLVKNGRNNQYDALVKLLKWLKEQYRDARIGFHYEFTSTSCPGHFFPGEKLLEDLKNEENTKTNKNYNDEIKIQRIVNGTFNEEEIDEKAYIINGRTYIPVRLIEEWFDEAEVKWDPKEGKYHIKVKS